jgi:type I restriction enzyme S subunit
MRWEATTLGTICEITSSKRIYLSDYVEDGVPFYRGKEIIQKSKFEQINEPYFISYEKFNQLSGQFGHPRVDDILITGVGTIGCPYLVSEDDGDFYFKDGNLLWLRNFGRDIFPSYLFYFFKSDAFRGIVNGISIGSSQKAITIQALKQIKIPLPPLPTQRRIASILSAYDDLIENNLKRIKLLEEAAQNIYREWFVHFRFPGHERVRWGADGLPEGWRRVQFSEVVQISPPTPIVKDEPAPYVPMASLSESMMIITDVETRIPSGGARFKNGDTLFARITPCLENGKTAFVQFLDGEQTATGSTEFIVFRETSSVNQFFIYCLSREYSFRQHAIKSMTGSDGRQRVKPEAFDSYFIAVPPTVVMDQFFTVAAPLFKQVQVLVNSNARLKEARDILLPRLMNRTIEV